MISASQWSLFILANTVSPSVGVSVILSVTKWAFKVQRSIEKLIIVIASCPSFQLGTWAMKSVADNPTCTLDERKNVFGRFCSLLAAYFRINCIHSCTFEHALLCVSNGNYQNLKRTFKIENDHFCVVITHVL